MTDGKMIYSENGDEIKQFHVRDGIAASLIREKGFRLGIMSAGNAEQAITKRFTRLGFEYISVKNRLKEERFQEFLDEFNVIASEVAYIGDDINDIKIMKRCGVAICPSDAHHSVIEFADWVLKSKGGEGCLREVSDHLNQLKS
ncbi:HAD hydrolase family protein [Cohnella sp. CFH 77786]|nr:HAD hydrolase family protein [Cohnella sp. CFH 77786]